MLGWPTFGAIDKIKQINLATLCGAITKIISLLFLYIVDEISIVNVAIMRNLSELMMFVVLLCSVIKYRKHFSSSGNSDNHMIE